MNSLTLLNKEDLREVMMEMMLGLLQQVEHKHAKMATVANESELMTRKEAAAYLKISLVTLNSWTRQGAIKSKRICGRVYYYRSELEQVPQ